MMAALYCYVKSESEGAGERRSSSRGCCQARPPAASYLGAPSTSKAKVTPVAEYHWVVQQCNASRREPSRDILDNTLVKYLSGYLKIQYYSNKPKPRAVPEIDARSSVNTMSISLDHEIPLLSGASFPIA